VFNVIKFLFKLFFSSIIPLLCYHLWWNKGFHQRQITRWCSNTFEVWWAIQ